MESINLEPKQAMIIVGGGLFLFVVLVTVIVYAGDVLHFAGHQAAQAKAVVEARVMPSPTPWPTETPMPAPTAMATATPEPEVIVKAPALNMRSGPGVDYERVGQVHEGDYLVVLARERDEQDREWLKVRTEDEDIGWVAGWYTRRAEQN